MSYPPYSPSLDENEASSSSTSSFPQPPSLYHQLSLNSHLQFWSPSHEAGSSFFQPQPGWGFNEEALGGMGGFGFQEGGGEEDQQAGMEYSQSEMEEMSPVPCTYFFSPQGCMNGDQCRFSHDENPQEQHQHQLEEKEDDNQEYGPPPPASRKRNRTVSPPDSEDGRHEKEAKLEDKAALLRRRLQEAKAARLSKPSSPSTSKSTTALTPPQPSSSPAPPSLPPHLLAELSTILSTITTTHSLLSLPTKPIPPPNPFHISPLTEDILSTRLEIERERGCIHRWGVVVEKGERVREELDERRRRREEDEAERVAFLRTSEGKDEQLELKDDSAASTVEEEDLRCALRVLGVLARGERELNNQNSTDDDLRNTNPNSLLPTINYSTSSPSSYSQGRSTFTSALTPPTRKAWTPQEHATLRRMEADLHCPPRMGGPLGGGAGGSASTTATTMGGGSVDASGYQYAGSLGGLAPLMEEPKLALPSRAEGGGW
ncbi:hypothetical protein BDY24DRAFT_392447 [Mrakia frigida]|uniref:zinc finger CCCH domain-containing protein n=1 Tax=Mrakia frigida TaxID=29902 RepID=UPI003FCC1EB5